MARRRVEARTIEPPHRALVIAHRGKQGRKDTIMARRVEMAPRRGRPCVVAADDDERNRPFPGGRRGAAMRRRAGVAALVGRSRTEERRGGKACGSPWQIWS